MRQINKPSGVTISERNQYHQGKTGGGARIMQQKGNKSNPTNGGGINRSLRKTPQR